MTSLYSLRRLSHDEYSITKFDRDFNPEGTYALSKTECSCPQSHRDRCRHRTMLPLFLGLNHVDDGWFLDWDTRQWQAPITTKSFGIINAEPIPQGGPDSSDLEGPEPFQETLHEQAMEEMLDKFATAYESESSNAALSTSSPTPAIKRRKI